MNNRGWIGLLIIAGIVLLVLAGVTFYFSFSKSGFSIQTGKVTVSIDYNATNSTNTTEDEISIIDRFDGNFSDTDNQNTTNSTIEQLSESSSD